MNKEEISEDKKIILFVNDKQKIHHVKERGYVESPVRISSILSKIKKSNLFKDFPITHFGEEHILEVHDKEYFKYFKKICSVLDGEKSIYPYVFPIRNVASPPKELDVRAGYYCIDTFTPLNKHAFVAAKRSVDTTLSGAQKILEGEKLIYCLTRPPGHHAEKKSFGGFCYFNSNAIAANYLSKKGKVAILDIDYHHGNGQQDIFYEREDVLTVSIHGHPKFAYPYFSGFVNERGNNAGEGFNINFPLKEKINGSEYKIVLKKALKLIKKFNPDFLVIALGLDPEKNDPTGTWSLEKKDFFENGFLIGSLKKPTLVVQEGGYDTKVLGINAKYFFKGLWKGFYS